MLDSIRFVHSTLKWQQPNKPAVVYHLMLIKQQKKMRESLTAPNWITLVNLIRINVYLINTVKTMQCFIFYIWLLYSISV